MQGEGERKEGEDDSEDSFEKYTEELGGKYEERGEVDEENSDATKSTPATKKEVAGAPEETGDSGEATGNQDGSVEKGAEPPKETGEINGDEFEAYAKELTEKYDEDRTDTYSNQGQGGQIESNDAVSSQEGVFRDESESVNRLDDAENGSGGNASAKEEAQRGESQPNVDSLRTEQSQNRGSGAHEDKTIPETQGPVTSSGQAEDQKTPSAESNALPPDDSVGGRMQREDDASRYERELGYEPGAMMGRTALPSYNQFDNSDRGSHQDYVRRGIPAVTESPRSPPWFAGTGINRLGEHQPTRPPNKRDSPEPETLAVRVPLALQSDGKAKTDPTSERDPRRKGQSAEADQSKAHNLRANQSEKRTNSLDSQSIPRPESIRLPEAESERLVRGIVRDAEEPAGITKPKNGVSQVERSPGEQEAAAKWRVIVCTIHKEFSRYVKLDFPRIALEEIYGQRLVSGRAYEIDWSLDGSKVFRTRFSSLKTRDLRPYIHLPAEIASRAKVGEKLPIHIKSIRETGTREEGKFRVDFTKSGPTIRLPAEFAKRASPGTWEDRRHERVTLELQIQNSSELGSSPRRYFRGYDIGSGRLYIRARRIGLKVGDRVKVFGVREYEIHDFVDDFNLTKPKGLDNVNLNISRGHLFLEVDNRKYLLANPILESRMGPRVTLSATTEGGDKPLRFTFDGKTMSAHLDKESIICIMGALEISYEARKGPRAELRYPKGLPEEVGQLVNGVGLAGRQPAIENIERCKQSIRPEAGFRLANHFDRATLENRIVASEVVKSTPGTYRFETDSIFKELVGSKLESTHDPIIRRGLKGRMGEQICSHLLSLTEQWEEVCDHPFGANGPDSLQRSRVNGQLDLFYFKWWEDVRGAYKRELKQESQYIEHQTYRGERISDTYTALLNWDYRKSDMTLHVRKNK